MQISVTLFTMLKPWKSIKIIADNKIVFITHQIYFQERTEELPGE